MIEVTERAADLLRRSVDAARRFQPSVGIRVSRRGGGVDFGLATEPSEGDSTVDCESLSLWIEAGLEGTIDVEEPHDRLVLRPAGRG